jgi:hypothetical protein
MFMETSSFAGRLGGSHAGKLLPGVQFLTHFLKLMIVAFFHLFTMRNRHLPHHLACFAIAGSF